MLVHGGDRIAQGAGSRSLTAGETGNVESKEHTINHEVHSDRKANGGTLTPAGEPAAEPGERKDLQGETLTANRRYLPTDKRSARMGGKPTSRIRSCARAMS